MANGQNTNLALTAAAAYFTGGASLAAQGAAGAGGISAGGSGGSNKGKGSSFASGPFSLAAGNVGPSSADAMFGSPYDVFDTSGWNISFGDASGINAAVGERGGNTSAPSMSKMEGADPVAGLSSATGIPGVYLVAGGIMVVALIAAAFKGRK